MASDLSTPIPVSALPTRFNEAGGKNTLRGWAALFVRYPSPRIIAAVWVVAVGARIAAGRFGMIDLIVAAAFVAAQPFTEWLIHVFILHFKPRRLGARVIDPFIARKHRAHHVDPVDIGLTFVALPALLGLIAVFFLANLAGFRDIHLALTAAVTGYTLLFVYEWTHFLIHSTYVPKTALYKKIWRSHRLHHFKNEHYWFGVTNPVGDIVLRTYPDKSAVPSSATARTLGAM